MLECLMVSQSWHAQNWMHKHSPQNPVPFWVLQNKSTIYLPGCARQNLRSLSSRLVLCLFNPHTQSVPKLWFSFLGNSWILSYPQQYHPKPSHHPRAIPLTAFLAFMLTFSKHIPTLKPVWPEGIVQNADVTMSSLTWKCSKAHLTLGPFTAPATLASFWTLEHTMLPSTAGSLPILFLPSAMLFLSFLV